MLANGASEALVDAASILAAVGIVAVGQGLRSRMPAAWEIVSWVTAAALVVGTTAALLQPRKRGPGRVGLRGRLGGARPALVDLAQLGVQVEGPDGGASRVRLNGPARHARGKAVDNESGNDTSAMKVVDK
jgi:hypothetical protein